MIGGGGEKVTMRVAARHADHWNVWGGPQILGRKGKILEDHATTLGRDPKTIQRSANMPVVISDDRNEVAKLEQALSRRFGFPESAARDIVLGGSVAEVKEKLHRLRDAGVDMLFVPTFLPANARPMLDRFIAEVAPSFR